MSSASEPGWLLQTVAALMPLDGAASSEVCRTGFYHVADCWIAAGFPLEAAEALEAMRQAQRFLLVAAAEASGAEVPCGPS